MQKRRQTANNKKEELYEPEMVLDKKLRSDGTQYLIKWKGFGRSDATWEYYRNISHCDWLFEEWEEKQNRKELKKIKNMDRIIDKKYISNKVYYLVSLKDGGEDIWVRRKILMIKDSDKVSEYEKNDQLVGAKRKFKQKRFSKSQDRFLSSDEDLSNSQSDHSQDHSENSSRGSRNSDNGSENSSDQSSRSSSKESGDENSNQRGQGKGRRKGRINNKQKKNKKRGNRRNQKDQENDNESDKNSCSSENSDDEASESRRIVKTKRKYAKKCKILYDKLPFYGILGIDEPKSIKNMVIDKRVGTKEDGYFACDIVWKIRPNKQQPIDSRVSRKDIKEFYPLILIEFYEYNMTYNGDVVNADDEDDAQYYDDEEEEEEDDDDDEKYYQKLQKKAGRKYNENEDSEADNQDQKSEESFYLQNKIYYGYAKTNEQKKYVKFDEKFFNNNQMEEM